MKKILSILLISFLLMVGAVAQAVAEENVLLGTWSGPITIQEGVFVSCVVVKSEGDNGVCMCVCVPIYNVKEEGET